MSKSLIKVIITPPPKGKKYLIPLENYNELVVRADNSSKLQQEVNNLKTKLTNSVETNQLSGMV